MLKNSQFCSFFNNSHSASHLHTYAKEFCLTTIGAYPEHMDKAGSDFLVQRDDIFDISQIEFVEDE